MNLFSISQLSQFSGIKPHTIRIWEQRYNALKPNRSEGNTRYYENSQLRRLLNIVSLTESGYRVSQLGSMTDEKLFELVKEAHQKTIHEQSEYFIAQLIAAGMNYDEIYFESLYGQCIIDLGMKNTYINVIYPMMERIGMMWTSDSIRPVHEHFISNIVRQKILKSIDALPQVEPSSSNWMLFLPENEYHEIGLLFAHYLIRLSGKKVIYLGANVPIQSVIPAISEISPENLLLFFVHYDLPENVQEYLDNLSSVYLGKNIYIAGNRKLLDQIESRKKIQFLQSVESLEQVLIR